MKRNDLETPALILDKRIFEANMDKMDKLLEGSGMKLRPHYKSNKCPEIAKIQIERGASGITCAKLGEAEDLAAAGIGKKSRTAGRNMLSHNLCGHCRQH